jgi:hypothetical protein
MPVKEQKCAQRLSLRGCAHSVVNRQLSQKGVHLWLTEFLGMSHLVELHESSDPERIGAFGSWAVVTSPELVPQAGEKPEIPTWTRSAGVGVFRCHAQVQSDVQG